MGLPFLWVERPSLIPLDEDLTGLAERRAGTDATYMMAFLEKEPTRLCLLVVWFRTRLAGFCHDDR